jgi:hypothetical protein
VGEGKQLKVAVYLRSVIPVEEGVKWMVAIDCWSGMAEDVVPWLVVVKH